MKTQRTGIRLGYVRKRLSPEDRKKLKSDRIKAAEEALNEARKWTPPTFTRIEVRLKPGDRGYEDALFEEVVTVYDDLTFKK